MEQGKEKRKVFRLELKTPLCTEMTISQLDEKLITSNITKICVINLSAIGLSFTSKLHFPVRSGVVYSFKTRLLGEYVSFKGIILWHRKYPDDIYRYGVTFLVNEDELKEYIQIFNRFSLLQRKSEEPLKSCAFCTYEECPNKIKAQE